jgi:hypothetical protein
VRFYVLSRIALFRSISSTDLKIETAMLLIGGIVFGLSLARARSSDLQLTVSSTLVSSIAR